jgi:type IV pilus assembly protein PilM
MFDFLKSIKSASFFKRGSYLGVDIGTTSIKVAEVLKGGAKPKLRNYGVLESYGHLERLNNAIQTAGLKIMDRDAAKMLKALLDQSKVKSKDVIASIPAFSAFITLLEIPQMSAADTVKTLPFQITQHIPLPVSEVAIDWMKVGEKEDEGGTVKQQVLIVSVPNEQISHYKSIFKMVGLNLVALEVESLSLARAFVGGDPTPTIIADIGSHSTNIVVTEKGFVKQNSQTDFAGASLTQAISSGLNINVRRAEQLKKQKGLLGGTGEYELSTLTIPFLDAIISEVRRAKDNFEKNQGIKIERAILAGGGANLLGIDKYFEKNLGLPSAIGNAFARVDYPSGIEPMVKILGPSFAVAVGLAIKEFV